MLKACLKNGSRRREEAESVQFWQEIRFLTSAATRFRQFPKTL